ncbi:ATP-dependent Clp protease adaptor protein ClpS [Desulfomicrobium apsheronum]|jgi:ATP-dependent Clp protease adaptor protein ClpS|uniref:ATP-dependent Clp protease adapter protein ClpS n=3 Tax=Desulfomicrobium TaxID=898 RepID=A0A1I3Q2W5_9BACT|nr:MULTISPECIES: ATP-dependent Clp protease adaptor ClpS [Desulfomicrobium]PKN42622.1 MAG: ATP-dependent Clp protease adaptor ClpS [Deltaproteobacteria bacterium HGW-Deltaproteobacteria-18]MBE1426984.1 ATP-dependent Clp protease adaptor protein ClpS [Desulfomicrobium macestii]MDY0225427.1 ATP-dependent Clp protease adaptor ClpS [Desulfomicrobium apsheronum]SFJ28049.1 ATP-dependent Clp protease adaptor protein ClpS [Desulfomicrobium apsheronum]SFL27161.1 ATP-dependent Clp protease adaptor prote
MTEPFEVPGSDPDIMVEDQLQEPRQFKVLLHNDDYTSMDFVVEVLMNVFGKSESESFAIMMSVHEKGIGLCGIYTAEVAETKVQLVHQMAKARSFPLRCSMEEV